ncbi:MAG: MFS transporter, partial [Clostridiales bacterium]|nr:MFS transporter [Clostridiales bacterium]
MGLLKKLFKNKIEQVPIETEEPIWDESVIKRSNIEIHNPLQRDKYVENCLEQIRDVEKEVVNLSFEYNLVTSYLKDMEEIEGLPKTERNLIDDCAKRIVQLNQESRDYKRRKNALSDAMYRKIQRIEENMPEGYDKLKEAENYQMLIKQDLTRLDGERHAFQYRKEELKAGITNSNGMTVISMVALGICILLLAILQFAFGLNVKIGYILSIGAAAVTVTFVFLVRLDNIDRLENILASTKFISTNFETNILVSEYSSFNNG